MQYQVQVNADDSQWAPAMQDGKPLEFDSFLIAKCNQFIQEDAMDAAHPAGHSTVFRVVRRNKPRLASTIGEVAGTELPRYL